MSRSTEKLSIPSIVLIGAVAVIAVIASGVLRGAPADGREPTTPPVASPAAPASPSAPVDPTPVPTAQPTPVATPADDPADGETLVKLDIADPHDVFVGVKDLTGKVVDATSGHAGDGMSVRWYDLEVENVDDDTLRLTWVGYPTDDPVKVLVFDDRGTPTIVLMQRMPPENSDALGFDRVLDLHFDGPVSPDDYRIVTQDGYDTAD
jgi:hypothetical protein